jgi:hypothetical protein
MVSFVVGMCCHDGVGTRDFTTTDVSTRFSVLKLSINMAFGKNLDPNTLYCFIAPEFFFGNQALPKSEYRKLLEMCRALYSAQNFILVPGSMVSYSGSKRSKKKDDFLNRVPIFYGGQMMEYDKSKWGGEVGSNNVGTYRNGTTDNLFRVQFGHQRYSFAIEVCMEHDSGVLAQRHGATLHDVHIITANTVGLKPPNTRASQYVIHCNASQQSPKNRGGSSGLNPMKVYDNLGQEVAPSRMVVPNQVAVWDLNL